MSSPSFFFYTRYSLSCLVRASAMLHFINANVYEFKETRGESMIPTLNTANDWAHTLKHYKNGRDVQMGDVIVAAKPTDPDEWVCKRISGMPGDTIIIDPSNESIPKNKDPQASFDKYIVVPEGHVWVTGDNLSYSLDSRTYSVLPMGLIKGKIVAANDFNESFKTFFGFRWLENNFHSFTSGEKDNFKSLEV